MEFEIVGESEALRGALDQVQSVARTRLPVLILGESGVGKEMIAAAIHLRSTASRGPLVRVNCAAVPRELFESEFFGHARGAFTGAHESRAGRFEQAAGGTLFLDEVSEIPLDLQGKLLRVLQEGEFERVGEAILRRSTARVVAASNRDLRSEVEAGRFREDLYYRLSVFPVEIPPLRERADDIARLATHFAARACAEFGCTPVTLQPSQLLELAAYAWPGNVRELKNEIERAVLLSRDGVLRFHLGSGPVSSPSLCEQVPLPMGPGILTYPELKKVERRAILTALAEAHWKVSGPGGAAAMLQVKPTTLASRMKAMGIARPR